MSAKKKVANLARKKTVSAKKAAEIKGGQGQAAKRLSDHRNEMRRGWAP